MPGKLARREKTLRFVIRVIYCLYRPQPAHASTALHCHSRAVAQPAVWPCCAPRAALQLRDRCTPAPHLNKRRRRQARVLKAPLQQHQARDERPARLASLLLLTRIPATCRTAAARQACWQAGSAARKALPAAVSCSTHHPGSGSACSSDQQQEQQPRRQQRSSGSSSTSSGSRDD
jgi:hypothetical protein